MSGLRGCQSWLSPPPEEPGTHAYVGKVELGQAFPLALLVTASGKGNFLLILVIAFFPPSFLGMRGRESQNSEFGGCSGSR